MLNLNDITFCKQLENLIDLSFEMPYVSYCQPLCGILTKTPNNETTEINHLIIIDL